jgi:hypothetical protein
VTRKKRIEIWFQDEARIGQKNGLVRQWARRGTRPTQPADQRYESAYLFGAICPARGVGAALALPFADTDAMQRHIDEIALHVARGAHAVLLLDRAGWHTTGNLVWPKNITPILLLSRSPELNPVEQVWQYLRANYLSNRRLRQLRRHHRRSLRGMAKTHRPAMADHINRNADLGP